MSPRATFGGAIAAILLSLGALLGRAQTPATDRIPILVELFTSEGCSSCPPADAVLTRLVTTQPVPGVKIIALGEHVTYWDQQGWRDPFSSQGFTDRQAEYSRALHIESPYTPQMIVNGREEFVGGDYATATRVLANVARDQARRLRLSLLVLSPSPSGVTTGTLPLRIEAESSAASGLRGAADVFVAVTEDGLRSHVERGENRGRDLQHTAVVRALTRVGTIAAKAHTWSGSSQVVLDARWRRQTLKIVAFAQDHDRRDVLGSTSSTLP